MAVVVAACTNETEEPRVLSRRVIGDAIKARAALRGITNPVLLAGIANHETNFVHCVADYHVRSCVQSPNTPSSASCRGDSVIIGNADATCDDGGIGLFQLDAGKQSDTVAAYPNVVELDGNIDAAIEHVLADVAACELGSSTTDALTWLNGATYGTSAYNTDWFRCVARQYNGCRAERGCDQDKRAGQYRAATDAIAREFGLTYWTPKTK